MKRIFILLTLCIMSLDVMSQVAPPLIEKIYVSHDKPVYSPGETIWCQVYHVDGMYHLPFDAQPVVHIQWLSPQGEFITKLQLKINKGIAPFEIELPRDIIPGDYTIRAFTQYQQNFDPAFFFQKKIAIIDHQEDIAINNSDDENLADVTFYPEGGYLVEGIKSKVGFKVSTVNDKGQSASGVIIDDQENIILNIKTLHNGFGFFTFAPSPGTKYFAKITSRDQEVVTPVPTALQNGYVIDAINHAADKIVIQLKTNIPRGFENATLIGHVRGNMIITQTLNSEELQIDLALAREQIPSGIMHFTLFNPENQPVAERLVYNDNPTENISCDVAWSSDNYEKKQRVDFNLLVTKMEQSIEAKTSATVYNVDLFPKSDAEMDIKSYLLLQSDLAFRVENIQSYFTDNNRKNRVLQDLLMMTQAWRRFKWLSPDKIEFADILYPTQQSQTILGKVTKEDSDEAIEADVFLNILDGASFGAMEMTTGEDGLFVFTDLNLMDTTSILIQASKLNAAKRERKLKEGESKIIGDRDVTIKIIDPFEKIVMHSSIERSYQWGEPNDIVALIKDRSQTRRVDSLFYPEWSLELDNITITASKVREEINARRDRLKNKYKDRGIPYFASSTTLFLEDVFKNRVDYQDIFELIRGRIPGVEVRGSGFEKIIQIRGISSINNNVSATILLDGGKISSQVASTIDPLTVYSIDVLKGLNASSLYGEAGAGGIVNIITRDPGDPMWQNQKESKAFKGVINMEYPGYYHSREFYIPNYSATNSTQQMPDYRNTLYWNPSITIENGKASGSFFTGDKSGNYVLKLEGITENGFPFIHFSPLKVDIHE